MLPELSLEADPVMKRVKKGERLTVATRTTIRKPKSVAARRRRERPHLRPQNEKLLRWLDSWLATPDDQGETWWTEFQADLQGQRVTFRPTQTG